MCTELFSTEAACMPWSAASAHRLQLHSSNIARGLLDTAPRTRGAPLKMRNVEGPLALRPSAPTTSGSEIVGAKNHLARGFLAFLEGLGAFGTITFGTFGRVLCQSMIISTTDNIISTTDF